MAGLPKSPRLKCARLGAWWILAAAVFAGCATPDRENVELFGNELPPQFLAARTATAEPDERWWDSFGDPDLAALIDQTELGNPTIGQAIARLRQARAEVRLARADRLPQVDAVAGAAQGDAGAAGFDPDNFDIGIEASWEADLWGRLAAEQSAARSEYIAAQADLRAVRQLIAAETARTYFTVIEAQAQVELSRRVLGTYDELIRQLDLRVAARVSPNSFLALAISDQQAAIAGLEQRKEDSERLIRRLDILLGDYPDGNSAIAQQLPAVPPTPATGVPSELLARRPDIRAAEAAIAAAGYRVDAARASLLPRLSLTGATGTSAGSFANLFDPGFFLWSIAGRLLQPIFQGGRLRARVELQNGELDERIDAYAETALQALFEVETALAVDDDIAAQEEAFDRSAVAAEEAVSSFNLRYRAGIDSFYNVLESQQRALDSRSGYLAARRARLINRVDLYLALGGGFEDDSDIAISRQADSADTAARQLYTRARPMN